MVHALLADFFNNHPALPRPMPFSKPSLLNINGMGDPISYFFLERRYKRVAFV